MWGSEAWKCYENISDQMTISISTSHCTQLVASISIRIRSHSSLLVQAQMETLYSTSRGPAPY